MPSPLSLCSISFDDAASANCSLTNCSLIRMAEAQHQETLSPCNPLLSKKPINTKSSFALRHSMAKQIKLPFLFVTAVFSLCKINEDFCGFGVSVLPGIACSHPSPSVAAQQSLVPYSSNPAISAFSSLKQPGLPLDWSVSMLDSHMVWKNVLPGNHRMSFSPGQIRQGASRDKREVYQAALI